jgi:AraC-like DNA-binding protein
MSLKNDDFEVSTATICGHDFKQRSGRHLVRPAPELMQRLVSLHNVVGQTARITPKVFELPRVTEALEHQLIHIMVRCLTDGLPSASSGSHRHGSIIAKFEEYLEANPNTPLYLAQICEATGTAERTLRAACEAHLGMGPIRYLALRRMHLVRRALLHASPNATVTSTVTDFGFWELGRFAVNYRALFGETPSDTLHRSHHRGAAAPKRPSSLQAAEFT